MQQPQAKAGLLFQNLVYSVVNKSPQCLLYLLCWPDLAHFLSLTIPALLCLRSAAPSLHPYSNSSLGDCHFSFCLVLLSSPSAASHSVEHSIRSALSELLLTATNYDQICSACSGQNVLCDGLLEACLRSQNFSCMKQLLELLSCK